MKVRTFGECKIIPKNIPVSTIKNRTFKSGETNEENLLVRDELRGICTYGKGYCFTMSQLEMIVTALKQKLSKIELDTLKISNDDFCYIITVKTHKQKATQKKQEKISLVSA